jgi:hypothetical protein
MLSLIIEAPRSVLDAPRTLLLESLSAWLEAQGEFAARLPATEIVITVLPRATLPPSYVGRSRQAIGCFAATVSGRLNPRWEVALAYGSNLSDAYDLQAWTVTLAHELLHLAAFASANHQQPPAQAGYAAVRVQAPDENAIEDQARQITDQFLALHPELLAASDLLLDCESLPASPSL